MIWFCPMEVIILVRQMDYLLPEAFGRQEI